MTDTELDEMLDRWMAPAAPASLQARVRAESDSRPKRSLRPGVWALASIAAVVLVGFQASPQKLTFLSTGARIPYSVDSEFFRYANDGTVVVQMNSLSYNREGREVMISRSLPNDPWGTLVARALDKAAAPVRWLTLTLTTPPEVQQRIRKLASVTDCLANDCFALGGWYVGDAEALADSGCETGRVVGHQAILGYATVGGQRLIGGNLRITVWMAPALGCFPLKSAVEEQQADGAFHAIRGRRALKITVNP